MNNGPMGLRPVGFSATLVAVKALKVGTLVGSVILAVILGGGVLMGRGWQVERSRVVRASPEQLHARLVDLRGWRDWASTDAARDPACTWTWGGDAGEPGSWMQWSGAPCGQGRVIITDADPRRGVWLDDRLGPPDDAGASTKSGSESFTFEAEGTGTRVTWRQEGATRGVAAGWLRPLVERRLEEHMERALAALARLVEAEAGERGGAQGERGGQEG